MEDIKKLKAEKLKRLQKEEKNIEQMLEYKNFPLKKATLNITVKTDKGLVTAIFPLSVSLGKETLMKDIEEDKQKLKLLKTSINKKIKEVKDEKI